MKGGTMDRGFCIGCVADDFTGAGDVASFFVKAGLTTVLYNGIPNKTETVTTGTQAVVIALKSRTQAREAAVADSLKAFRWLFHEGAKKLYFKYCSTFDSTSEGNIGPVADAVMEEFKFPYTILCPAFPVNGRTVQNGTLYVNGIPLDKSPMGQHPLTPMQESQLVKLIEMQSRYKGVSMAGKEPGQWKKEQETLCAQYGHAYLIPDYYEDIHGEEIAHLFQDITFYTGGSGLAEHVGRRIKPEERRESDTWAVEKGRVDGAAKGRGAAGTHGAVRADDAARAFHKAEALLLAGSCSAATLKQIRRYKDKGYPSYKIDAARVLSGHETSGHIWHFVEQHPGENVLIYSSDTPDHVKQIQKDGKNKISYMLEQLTAELAAKAAELGYRKFIVAGGETSGAVIQRLGYRGFWIGNSITPGVPVMIPLENTGIRLVLKSGNFGQEDFFEQALKELEGEA